MKIGDLLKQARIEKGLTLSQVAKEIFIQEKNLRALEEGEYDLIPGEAYQRAYFRTYAEYLGLSEYIEGLTRPHKFSSEKEEQPVSDIFGGSWDSARIVRVCMKLGLILIAVALIVFLVKAFNAPRKPHEQPQRVNSTQPGITVVPLDSTQPQWQAPAGAAPPPAGSNPNTHELKLKAKGQCWVVVKTRDGTVFIDTMLKDDEKTFTDLVGFYLFTGRPENLTVVFDGKAQSWGSGEDRMILPPGAAVIPPDNSQTVPDSSHDQPTSTG